MYLKQELPRWLNDKESSCQCGRHRLDPWGRKISWRRKRHPLQYSCLGNPRDRGACRLQSMGSQRVGQTEQLSLHRCIYCRKKSLHVDGKEDTFFFCLKARFPSFNTALETQPYRSVTQFITRVSECNLLSLKEPSS